MAYRRKMLVIGAGKTGLGHILKKARVHMDDLGIDISNGDRVALVMDLDLIYSEEDVRRPNATEEGSSCMSPILASRYGCCSISVVSTGPATRRISLDSCPRSSEENM